MNERSWDGKLDRTIELMPESVRGPLEALCLNIKAANVPYIKYMIAQEAVRSLLEHYKLLTKHGKDTATITIFAGEIGAALVHDERHSVTRVLEKINRTTATLERVTGQEKRPRAQRKRICG